MVNQYINAEAGAKGLGEIVDQIASTAIKVLLVFMSIEQPFFSHAYAQKEASFNHDGLALCS